MDIESLLNDLAALFGAERNRSGLIVDRIGVAPAYDGMVKDSYILAVSSPSLATNHNCGDKADTIIDLLFSYLPAEQRATIDRVRVYDSAEELERHARRSYDEGFYNYCEAPLPIRGNIREIA